MPKIPVVKTQKCRRKNQQKKKISGNQTRINRNDIRMIVFLVDRIVQVLRLHQIVIEIERHVDHLVHQQIVQVQTMILQVERKLVRQKNPIWMNRKQPIKRQRNPRMIQLLMNLRKIEIHLR